MAGRRQERWNHGSSALTRAPGSGMRALASACVEADMWRALIEYHTGTHIHSRRLSVLNGIQVCHRPSVPYAIALQTYCTVYIAVHHIMRDIISLCTVDTVRCIHCWHSICPNEYVACRLTLNLKLARTHECGVGVGQTLDNWYSGTSGGSSPTT